MDKNHIAKRLVEAISKHLLDKELLHSGITSPETMIGEIVEQTVAPMNMLRFRMDIDKNSGRIASAVVMCLQDKNAFHGDISDPWKMAYEEIKKMAKQSLDACIAPLPEDEPGIAY